MFDVGVPERTSTMTGKTPLKVTLGSASAVTAYVNDRAVEIPRRKGRDASKFVVAADGNVTVSGAPCAFTS